MLVAGGNILPEGDMLHRWLESHRKHIFPHPASHKPFVGSKGCLAKETHIKEAKMLQMCPRFGKVPSFFELYVQLLMNSSATHLAFRFPLLVKTINRNQPCSIAVSQFSEFLSLQRTQAHLFLVLLHFERLQLVCNFIHKHHPLGVLERLGLCFTHAHIQQQMREAPKAFMYSPLLASFPLCKCLYFS